MYESHSVALQWFRDTKKHRLEKGHLLLKVWVAGGRGIIKGIAELILPSLHQITMLSDTLNLFVS